MADKDLINALKTQLGVNVAGSAYPYDRSMAADIFSPTGRYKDTSGVKQINYDKGDGEYGSYSNKKPGEVNLSPEMLEWAKGQKLGYTPAETFVHEHQHLLDNERKEQDPRFRGTPLGELSIDDLNKGSKAIGDSYDKYKDKYNLSDDFTGRGFYPELARIQSKLPAGKNIFDTDIGKDLLKAIPQLKTLFYQVTTPIKGTEMHAPGHAGETNVPINQDKSILELIQNYIRNKTAY